MLHTFGSIGQIRFRYHLIIFDLKRNTVCSSYCNMLMRLFGLLILSNCTWCTPVCCTVTDRIITKLFWKWTLRRLKIKNSYCVAVRRGDVWVPPSRFTGWLQLLGLSSWLANSGFPLRLSEVRGKERKWVVSKACSDILMSRSHSRRQFCWYLFAMRRVTLFVNGTSTNGKVISER